MSSQKRQSIAPPWTSGPVKRTSNQGDSNGCRESAGLGSFGAPATKRQITPEILEKKRNADKTPPVHVKSKDPIEEGPQDQPITKEANTKPGSEDRLQSLIPDVIDPDDDDPFYEDTWGVSGGSQETAVSSSILLVGTKGLGLGEIKTGKNKK